MKEKVIENLVVAVGVILFLLFAITVICVPAGILLMVLPFHEDAIIIGWLLFLFVSLLAKQWHNKKHLD